VEDRLRGGERVRPGLAALTLVGILVISAGWWALALWPASTAAPDWLLRTRAACFGAAPGGLPSAGGWILLIGEPIGMLGVLVMVWGDALRRDLRWLQGSHVGEAVVLAVPILVLLGLSWSGGVVARTLGIGVPTPPAPAGVPVVANEDVRAFVLVDQEGSRRSLAERSPGPTLVTFAFGRCETVCPTLLHDLRRERRTAGWSDVPILVITVDPWRDTPARLPTLMQQWQLEPTDAALSGTPEEVEAVLDALGVVRVRDQRTGSVDHVAGVLLLEGGRVRGRLEGGWADVTALLAAVGALSRAQSDTP
jgi:protein SCO1/2